jgi:predicted flap endonuclease-1-like 5' DNA nuclease
MPAATVYGVPAAGLAPRPPQEPQSKRGRIPDIDMSDAGGGYPRGAAYVPPRSNVEAVPVAQHQQRQLAPYSYMDASNEAAPAAAAAAPTTLVAWLSRNGLPPSLAAVLRSAGVNTVADLQYVTDADVAALGVPLITRRRLFASVVQQ